MSGRISDVSFSCIKWSVYIVFFIIICFSSTYCVEIFGVDKLSKFVGIFTPLIVALVTIYLSNRQHNIADAQRAVAEVQAKTASNKLRLDLFDKRFDIYQNIIEIKACIDAIEQHINFRIKTKSLNKYIIDESCGRFDIEIEERKISAQEKLKELESNLGKIGFLFNEISQTHCREIISGIKSYFYYVECARRYGTDSHSNNEYALNLYIRRINESYRNIVSLLKAYMDLSKIQ